MQARERLFNNQCNYFCLKPGNTKLSTLRTAECELITTATPTRAATPETPGTTGKHSGQAMHLLKQRQIFSYLPCYMELLSGFEPLTS
ncbi:MAG: hypothetical protein KDI41_04590, partial [Pseudomonadales bacterium]|nr:hypothetical protein [Pseudomonadales bacterium]